MVRTALAVGVRRTASANRSADSSVQEIPLQSVLKKDVLVVLFGDSLKLRAL